MKYKQALAVGKWQCGRGNDSKTFSQRASIESYTHGVEGALVAQVAGSPAAHLEPSISLSLSLSLSTFTRWFECQT